VPNFALIYGKILLAKVVLPEPDKPVIQNKNPVFFDIKNL
jgi:hypothetical protein